MNSNTPTEVQVITEIDVYEASVRKVVSSGNLNASPLVDRDTYSWSDVEEQTEREKKNKVEEKPAVEEKPKVEEKPAVEEKPKVEEPDAVTLSLTKSEINEHLDKLMSTIADIVNTDSNIKVDVELESDEDMSELVENDMPELVESDTDSDMPELVEDSDSENEWTPHSENDDLMVAVFKRPSCPRCEAALKILLAHEENSDEGSEISEQEHTSEDSDESAADDISDESNDSDESDDSDSDYVPSETESERESPRTMRQLRRWNASESAQNTQTSCVPSFIQFIFTVLVVVHILKFLLNEPHQRIRCYS
jgi:hypothetical protein